MPASSAGLLTIDCGNSTVDCLRHADGQRRRFDNDGDFGAALTEFLRAAPITRCIAVRVIDPAATIVASALAALRVPLAWAGIELPCPLRLDYEVPGSLGPDRWLGALAAHRRFGAAIVVDCGTATTINLVDASGTFRGGAIAPGLRAMQAGMAAVTPRLPVADLDAVPCMPARSSSSAVSSGVLLGYCGMVERLVADAIARAGGSVQVVVTGGNAERLLRHSRLRPHHEPALVHLGLRHLIEDSACGS
ncbi:MAG: type III pantothenate kinase [Planctomycetes bacterium]|jgi:type III pantothenate kinase|nr:type III pantothenate kinase [Planctomycetota bacterium]